jgi:hypothetical protein
MKHCEAVADVFFSLKDHLDCFAVRLRFGADFAFSTYIQEAL